MFEVISCESNIFCFSKIEGSIITLKHLVKATYFFVTGAVVRIILGRSFGEMIIIKY